MQSINYFGTEEANVKGFCNFCKKNVPQSNTMNILVYPWKDLTFTILLTYTTIMLINVFFSNGLWFYKWSNVFTFALTTGIASIVRHNGFFFTVPLYILIIFLYSKLSYKVPSAIAIAVAFILLVKFPLYDALNVTSPNNTYQESVGIPMTILGDTLVKKPSALPPKAKEFLNAIASDEEWFETYIPGTYNSIKHNSNASNVVVNIPPKTLIQWTLQTCINAKRQAFEAVCQATSIVWKIEKGGGLVGPPASANNIISKVLHICFIGYSGLCLALPVISSLFTSVGLLMLILLLVGILSLSKNGAIVLPLVIPTVCYNLGTMLLLCGNDVRFFHFNVVITLPLLFVLLTKPKSHENVSRTKKAVQ
jgi:hypothetical protein